MRSELSCRSAGGAAGAGAGARACCWSALWRGCCTVRDGGAVGGSSRLLLYPDAHMVVAMICNFEGGWQADEVESVGEAFEAK